MVFMVYENTSNVQTVELNEIKDWNPSDFIKDAVHCALEAAKVNPTQYMICVTNLESLMWDDLETDTVYLEALLKKQAELVKARGSEDDHRWELAKFQFRLLYARVKKKIPKEVTGELR